MFLCPSWCASYNKILTHNTVATWAALLHVGLLIGRKIWWCIKWNDPLCGLCQFRNTLNTWRLLETIPVLVGFRRGRSRGCRPTLESDVAPAQLGLPGPHIPLAPLLSPCQQSFFFFFLIFKTLHVRQTLLLRTLLLQRLPPVHISAHWIWALLEPLNSFVPF